jgi:hypothetical protein
LQFLRENHAKAVFQERDPTTFAVSPSGSILPFFRLERAPGENLLIDSKRLKLAFDVLYRNALANGAKKELSALSKHKQYANWNATVFLRVRNVGKPARNQS